jgi:ABC-type molybdate transport system ATPase subunit
MPIVLVSHRFSAVRLADRIAVVEGGQVIELGSHEELMELSGRYRTMYDLQASRFTESGAADATNSADGFGEIDREELTYDSLN